jgi:hypothetical protein
MTTESLPRQTWTERYEELRNATPAQRGLALFLRHGLAGWMAAWRTLVGDSHRPAPSCVAVPAVPPDLRSELAGTLASIALRSCRTVNA